MVVVLREAVGFVAHLLEDAQGGVVAWQAARGRAGLDVDLLLLALAQRSFRAWVERRSTQLSNSPGRVSAARCAGGITIPVPIPFVANAMFPAAYPWRLAPAFASIPVRKPG